MNVHLTLESYAATRRPVMYRGRQIGHWYTLPSGECRYFSNKWFTDPLRGFLK